MHYINYTNIGIISKTIAEYLEKEDLGLYYRAAHYFNPGVRITPPDYIQSIQIYDTEQDLQQYASLPHLRKIDMRMCNNIGKRVWKGVFSNVVKLNMTCCKQIDDISLKYIADGFKCLESIDISTCKVTDVGIRFLTKLTKLKKIQMSFCKEVSLDEISKITTLTKIMASFCKIDDKGLKLIEEFKLEKLRINGCHSITCKGILSISKIKTLKHLQIAFCCTNENNNLASLSHLTNLKLLDLSGSKISDNKLSSILQSATELTELRLSNCYSLTSFFGLQFATKLNNLTLSELFEYEHLIYLLPMTNLTTLNIESCKDEEFIESIPNKSNLINLDISRNISEGNSIGEFVSLTNLDLSVCPEFEFNNMSQLVNLTNLQYLNLNSKFPTSEHIKHIFLLTNLLNLNLSVDGPPRKDHIENLTGISKLQKLTCLSTNRRKINKEGMEEIAKLTQLKQLQVSYSKGLDDDILTKWTTSLTNLTILDISYNKIGIKSISHLPKLKLLTILNIGITKKFNLYCLEVITSMVQLRELGLESCRLRNKDIPSLSNMTNLVALNISSSFIRASGINILSKLPKLTTLIMCDCNDIKTGGLNGLTTSKTLSFLNINYCNNLQNEDLLDIANICNLSVLNISNCHQIDKENIHKLTETKSFTRIEYTSQRCNCGDCSECDNSSEEE